MYIYVCVMTRREREQKGEDNKKKIEAHGIVYVSGVASIISRIRVFGDVTRLTM